MERRRFIVGIALGLGCAAPAGAAARVYRVGLLETVPAAQNAANLDALRAALRAHGYVEGRNLVLDYRSADGHAERFPALAEALVRAHADVIVARGTPATQAARRATATIPVVMATMGDPRATAGDFARPAANVTGLTTFSTELTAKRVELLRELVPGMARVALLHNMANPAAPAEWEEAQSAARRLGLGAVLLDVRSEGDLDAALARAAADRVDALVVGADGLLQMLSPRIVAQTARLRLPAAYPSREFVDAGGLVAYAVNYPALYARFADYVDRILKGARPADLPVEQPATFELVVNLRTASALALTVPPAVLVRATDVIR